jgi:hypothetical protein
MYLADTDCQNNQTNVIRNTKATPQASKEAATERHVSTFLVFKETTNKSHVCERYTATNEQRVNILLLVPSDFLTCLRNTQKCICVEVLTGFRF